MNRFKWFNLDTTFNLIRKFARRFHLPDWLNIGWVLWVCWVGEFFLFFFYYYSECFPFIIVIRYLLFCFIFVPFCPNCWNVLWIVKLIINSTRSQYNFVVVSFGFVRWLFCVAPVFVSFSHACHFMCFIVAVHVSAQWIICRHNIPMIIIIIIIIFI